MKEKKLPMVEANMAQFKKMSDERRRMRRLRHDLERVRLLCELIRKREQRKRELLAVSAEIKTIQLNPFLFFLRKLLEHLEELDTQDIFADPVDPDEVPDYLDIVKIPMDFSKMKEKTELFEYVDIDDFEKDFTLMVNNCLAYNERETIFYRAGTKMRDVGGSIIRQARRQAEMLGFDPDTGMLTGEGPKKEEISDDRLMRDIDEFLNDETAREALEDEEHLKQLLIVQDKAGLIHHPTAKTKRLQKIKTELQKLGRKMSIEKSVEKGEKKVGSTEKQGVEKKKREDSEEGRKEKIEEAEDEERGKEKKEQTGDQKVGVNADEESEEPAPSKKKSGRSSKDDDAKKKPVDEEKKKKSSSKEKEEKDSEAALRKKAGRPSKSKKEKADADQKKRKRDSSDEGGKEKKVDGDQKKRKRDSSDEGGKE